MAGCRRPGRARTQGIAGTWPPRGAAQAGGYAPSGLSAWSSFAEKLREWVRAEAGAGRLLPWVPVAFGTGIAFYFAADHEPVMSVAAVAAAGLAAAAFLLRRQKIFPFLVLIAAVAAGFAAATWKTVRIAHGVLARPAYSVSLSGFVEARDIRERTDRFVLRVAQMDGPRIPTKLERVRLSVRKGTAPAVGSFVELKARLQPPLAPLRPGSYDFARDMFFQGIGASGFRHRRDQDRRAAGRRRPVAALRRFHAGAARCDRRAHPDDAGRRQACDRDGASDRPPRRYHRPGQRCDVHFRTRTRAVDFGISHGCRRRRRVFRRPRAIGAVPAAHGRVSDQEMGGRRGHSPPPHFTFCCRAPKSPRSARST